MENVGHLKHVAVLLLVFSITKSGDCGWCEDEWHQYDTKCYWFNNLPSTLSDATKYCQGQGSQLASVNSQDEANFILNTTQPFWPYVGLKRLNSGCDTIECNQNAFYWIDGSPTSSYKTWMPGHPKLPKNESGCGILTSYGLKEAHCNSSIHQGRFICEKHQREGRPGTIFSCSFGGSLDAETSSGTKCGLYEEANDDIDWKLQKGSINGEGPPEDLTGNGYYLCNHAHRERNGAVARISTIDRLKYDGPVCVWFAYYIYGANIGSLRMYTALHSIRHQRTYRFERNHSWANSWVMTSLQFRSVYNDIIGWEATKGSTFGGEGSDIAIDNIFIHKGECKADLFACGFGVSHGEICGMEQATDDDFDWDLRNGSTPSDRTGPMSGVGGSGFYIYIETSAPRKSYDVARIFMPAFDHNGKFCVQFAYHMYGVGVGWLKLVDSAGEEFWGKFGEKYMEQDQGWYYERVEVNLSPDTKLGWEGRMGGSFLGDIAIDDIKAYAGSCVVAHKSGITPNTFSKYESDKGYGLGVFEAESNEIDNGAIVMGAGAILAISVTFVGASIIYVTKKKASRQKNPSQENFK